MHSISTSTPLGSCFTATQLRAGLWTNHLAYSSFMLCGTPRPFSASGTTTPPLAAGVCTHGKVGHVGQEDVDLDHLLDRRAGLLEDGLEVADAGRRLLLDRALDQVALGVAGDLARAVDGAGRLDGLGLVAGGQSVSQSVSQSASQPASQPHSRATSTSIGRVAHRLGIDIYVSGADTYVRASSWARTHDTSMSAIPTSNPSSSSSTSGPPATYAELRSW